MRRVAKHMNTSSRRRLSTQWDRSPYRSKLSFLVFLILLTTSSHAAWRASTQSGDWSNTATWGGLSVPVDGDQVSIGAGHTVNYYGDLSKSAGQLEINGGRLNIVGNLTLGSSVLSGTTSAGGQLFVYGNYNQQSNFQINGGATVVVMNNMTSSGIINVNNGLLVVNGNLTKSNTVTVDNSSNIVVSGNYTSTAGDTWINSGNAFVFNTISCSGSNCNLIKNEAAWNTTPTHPGYQYLTNGTMTFSTSGTFTVPEGVTSITVQAWGGGGGGSSNSGGGGGGGAYATNTISVNAGDVYSLSVGPGGSPGNAGGNSTFGTNIVRAAGGSGSTNYLGASGGQSSNSIGSTKFNGGNGGVEVDQAVVVVAVLLILTLMVEMEVMVQGVAGLWVEAELEMVEAEVEIRIMVVQVQYQEEEQEEEEIAEQLVLVPMVK